MAFTGTQPPPPFLPPIDPTLIQRQLNIPQVGDPRLGGPFGAAPSASSELARLIAAIADIRRGNIGGRGARAQRGAEFGALQHLAFGTLPETGPLTQEQTQFQEQARQLKEARVRNVTGRKRGPIQAIRKLLGAPKEGAPATRRELLGQQEKLIRMIQNPEFYKALQENEPSRQIANRSLASRGIHIPSLQEEQAGQRLTTSQQDFAAFQQWQKSNPGATAKQVEEAKFRFGLIPAFGAALPGKKELSQLQAEQALRLQQERQTGVLAAIRLRAELRRNETAFSNSIKDKELRRKLADNLRSAEETAGSAFDDRFPDLDTAKEALQDPFFLRAWAAIIPGKTSETLTQEDLDIMREQWVLQARDDALENMREFGVAPEQLRPTPPQPEPTPPQPEPTPPQPEPTQLAPAQTPGGVISFDDPRLRPQ